MIMSEPQLFKIAVSAFIVKDGRILLLKRKEDEMFLPGVWEVPGGGVDQDETIEQAVVRETKEEAGLTVTLEKLFSYFEYTDGFGQKTVNLNFICRMKDASQSADTSFGEMERADWVLPKNFADKCFTSEIMLEACKDALRLTKK